MKLAHELIIKPIITERSVDLMSQNKYTFKVDKGANKIEIKEAIEEIFKVRVVGVATMRVKGKKKRMGRYQGMTSEWKKAIVTLAEGETIEVFEGM